MKALRPHQVKAIDMLTASLRSGNKRPMLQMATGAGKTLIAAHIIKRALAKGNRCCFAIPSLSLIDQTVSAFKAEGINDIGVIQANHPETDHTKPVQVASIQTLSRRNMSNMHFDLIIIDEAHIGFAFIGKWMEAWDRIPFIGLSASPFSRGLGKLYDDLLTPITMQELIDQGHLSPFKVFAPSSPDLSGVKIIAGDYHEGQLGEVMNNNSLVADIVSTWLAVANNEPTICFGVDCAHAKHICDSFTENGVSAAYIDAHVDMEDRQVIFDKFASGEVKVICNVGCLVVGFDANCRCLILARPTKSKMRFLQMCGRALRAAEDKEFATILDHSDTHARLGFVSDIHCDKLHSGKANESGSTAPEEKVPKACSKCKFMKPVGAHECPHCGHKPERQNKVETKAGELVELSAGQKRNNKSTAPVDKRRFYGELLGYCKLHGKSPGYASQIYRQKYGVWPNAYKDAEVVAPGAITLSYIKSRQIAYARSIRRRN